MKFMNEPWQWILVAALLAAAGVYSGKQDFETSLLTLICLAMASVKSGDKS